MRENKAKLEWVSGASNPADIFTKSTIQRSSYCNHLEALGIVERRPPGDPDAVGWDMESVVAILGKEPDVPALVDLDLKFLELKLEKLCWLVVEYCTSPESNLG